MIKIIHPKFVEYGGAERKILLIANKLLFEKIEFKIYANDFDSNKCFPDINEKLKKYIYTIYLSRFIWIICVNFILLKSLFDGTKLIYVSNHPSQFTVILPTVFGLGKKILWICNEVQEDLRKNPTFYNKICIKINYWLCKKIRLVISNSCFTSKKINLYYRSVSKIIYPGVDLDRINKLSKSNIPSGIADKFYLFIGRIEDGKNIDLLLILAKKYVYFNFLIIGSGSKLDHYKACSSDINNIQWLGSVTDELKFSLIRRAQGLIFPSKHEPFGVVVLEALSLGCPVLAFNSAGPKEIIVSKEMGILVNSDEEYIDSLIYLNRNPNNYRLLFGHVKSNFSQNIMVEKILKL